MRVLVCGGRAYRNARRFKNTMEALHKATPIVLVIHGGAAGADTLAERWAVERGVPRQVFPANWAMGHSAGPIRNTTMLVEGKPDLVVAFPGGRGTDDLAQKARARGIKVQEVI